MEHLDESLKKAEMQKRRFGQAELARFCGVHRRVIQRIEYSALRKIRRRVLCKKI